MVSVLWVFSACLFDMVLLFSLSCILGSVSPSPRSVSPVSWISQGLLRSFSLCSLVLTLCLLESFLPSPTRGAGGSLVFLLRLRSSLVFPEGGKRGKRLSRREVVHSRTLNSAQFGFGHGRVRFVSVCMCALHCVCVCALHCV